jgi:hypothetical protein
MMKNLRSPNRRDEHGKLSAGAASSSKQQQAAISNKPQQAASKHTRTVGAATFSPYSLMKGTNCVGYVGSNPTGVA